jgi:hypothetical protein
MQNVDPEGRVSDFEALWALALELARKQQFDEALAVGGRLALIADREDPDELELVAAGALRCALLRKAARDEELLRAAAELDERYGRAADPLTRAVAARARFDVTWALLRSGREMQAIEVIDRLAGLLERETDDAVLRELAETLAAACSQLCWAGKQPQSLIELTFLCAVSIPGTAYAHQHTRRTKPTRAETLLGRPSRRKRVAKLIRRRERLKHAVRGFEIIRTRFQQADDEQARRLFVMATLHRAVALTTLGQLARAKPAWDELFALPDSDLGALLRDAKPGADGSYTATHQAAAWAVYAKGADGISPALASIAERIRKHRS